MLDWFLGAVTAIAVALCVEFLRRPRLSLKVDASTKDVPYSFGPPYPSIMRTVRVRLHNKPFTGPAWLAQRLWLEWIITRLPASQCRAKITFHHLDTGQNAFEGRAFDGRAMDTMDGRWSSFPERVPNPIFEPKSNEVVLYMTDLAWLTRQSRVDVYPGESEALDIAVRCDEDIDCFGWNDESYRSTPPWRNPAWKLGRGRYLVRVVVASSGQQCVGHFRLFNDGTRGEFRLEPASDDEIDLLPPLPIPA